MSEATKANSETSYKLPSSTVMQHACKMAIVEDRPMMMDYWVDSLDGGIFIGVREGGEKLLVKNADEYTSHISKIFKVGEEYLIMTENSIYVVSAKITSKRIS